MCGEGLADSHHDGERRSNMMIRTLWLDGFLSFAPGSEPFELKPLNVLIGPNGSGKSNVIEALGLLAATPHDLAGAVRRGGGIRNWIWKGKPEASEAVIQVQVPSADGPADGELRYRLGLGSSGDRLEVVSEEITAAGPVGNGDTPFYYLSDRGDATLWPLRDGKRVEDYRVGGEDYGTDQSILSQRRDPHHYPEITWLGRMYSGIRAYTDWTFGSGAPARIAQSTALPTDILLPDASNLALVLNEIEHAGDHSINNLLKRFFPLFERLSIRIFGGTTNIYLFETGAKAPIPAIRLSDGTLCFLALLAALYSPSPPSLLCIDEPELGLHPDAVTLLADVLVEASARMQLIVTTHSASLVSALTAHGDSIVTCERLGGSTVLNRVDPEEVANWLADYTLGDLWQMGVLGGNP